MLSSYFKTAFRSITRHPFYSLLNIAGLSIGIAFALLTAAYGWSEWRVNRQLKNSDRQYILTTSWKDPNMGFVMATEGPLAKALRENYPGLVANYYRFDGVISTVSAGDKHFREDIQIGDSTLLGMYGFPLLYGDARTALTEPHSMLITADEANKYFGRTDVVGRYLTIDDFSGGRKPFRITGVLPEPTRNSVTWLNESNNNRIILSVTDLAYFGRDLSWHRNNIVSYVELRPGVTPEALEGPIKHLVEANAPPVIVANMRVLPVPLTTYYLQDGGGAVSKLLYTLSFIALFILIMAIVNFINLAVSRSTARMREIGVRKVLGSLRRQLIGQFLAESVVLAAAAMLFSLLIYSLLAPWLSGIFDKPVPSLFGLPVLAWPLIGAFTLLLGLLAGLYPALLLSSLGSVNSLKGKITTVGGHFLLRKGLVGFQFATATVALIGAFIISKQIRLFFSDRLGYDKDYIVSVQMPRDWTLQGVQKMETVRSEFLKMPGIGAATLSFEIPDGAYGGSRSIWSTGGDSTRAVSALTLVSDEHFARTFGIPMAAGVFYHAAGETSVQDTARVVLNATAAKTLGWKTPQEAVGKSLRISYVPTPLIISGVVDDFHFDRMVAPIQPMIFLHVDRVRAYRYLSFKLRPGKIGGEMERLREEWATLLHGTAFDYHFMDETLLRIYTDELRLRKAASTATALALVIVLLGVIGLLSLSIRRRSKEMAIRKIVGAGVSGIVRLFIREYLSVLLLAGVVASGPAYLLMRRWLENYATRITITFWPFFTAIGCLALIMVVLIALQTLRTATSNPVEALRSE